jgi:hypothetical protein
MLQAKKVSMWRNRYRIIADGQPVATWDGSVWKVGGQLELAGRRYQVRGNMWGSKYGMATEDGVAVAAADRVGRKRWTVEADGRTYEFRRASMWRQEEELHSGGRRVGSVKRTSVWRGDAVAELPGLALPVQIFVLAVVLTMWDSQSAAASTAAAGGAAGAGGAGS